MSNSKGLILANSVGSSGKQFVSLMKDRRLSENPMMLSRSPAHSLSPSPFPLPPSPPVLNVDVMPYAMAVFLQPKCNRGNKYKTKTREDWGSGKLEKAWIF